MYYFNLKTWAITTLPAPETIRVHFLTLFLLLPVIGLAFLMFLPAIGFVMVGKAIVAKCGHASLPVLAHDAPIGAVHLTGQEPGPGTDGMDALADEVDRRRFK